ncbi:hypothetical protein Tco_0979294, partial [Tanacetum coccineum]
VRKTTIKDSKAPGPDGFIAAFFKKAWRVIGNDVCKAVKEFFSSGRMLGEINATIISLIPNVETPNKNRTHPHGESDEVIEMVVEVVVAVWQVVKMMMYGVDDDSVVMWMMVEGGVARLEWPEISSENMGGAGKLMRGERSV